MNDTLIFIYLIFFVILFASTFAFMFKMMGLIDSYGDFQEDAEQQFSELTDEDLVGLNDSAVVSVLSNPDDYDPSNNLIELPASIMWHILEQEMGYNKDVDMASVQNCTILDSLETAHNVRLGFSVNKKISAKKLLREISQSCKVIPTLANDKLKFIHMRDYYKGGSEYWDAGTPVSEEVAIIKDSDIIKHKFSRTSVEDVLKEQ